MSALRAVAPLDRWRGIAAGLDAMSRGVALYFVEGGFDMNLNVSTGATREDAMAHPANYRALGCAAR